VIHKADECFLTNTSMEVMPVTMVDGHPVGNGTTGPLTQQLHRLFIANRARFSEP
jgi:branched-chain amino acid aminotransferase